jgi:hypothetical protein
MYGIELLACAATSSVALSLARPFEERAPELGRVAWRRELDALLAPDALAKSTKATLVLFQEVPG